MADDCAHFQTHPRFLRVEKTVDDHETVLRGKRDDAKDTGLIGRVDILSKWWVAAVAALAAIASSMGTLVVQHLLK